MHQSKPIPANSDILYYWIKLIGMVENDTLNITIHRNDGKILKTIKQTINKKWVHYFFYFGIELPTDEWPSHQYNANISIIRNEKVINRKKIQAILLNEPITSNNNFKN